jgi:hypothetical protein
MSTENLVSAIPLPVAADYSTTGQYLFVDVNSSGQAVLVAGQGLTAIGVLQDNPGAAGRVGRIAIGGMIKVKAGATIAAGNKITTGADGRAEVSATGDFTLGTAISGGADGEIITILFQPQDISA